MREGCLELTYTESEFRHSCIVNPCLLEDVATRGSGIDTDIIVNLAEGLTSEADDGIGLWMNR